MPAIEQRTVVHHTGPKSRERKRRAEGVVKREAYNQMNLAEDVNVLRFYGSKGFVVLFF